MSAPSVASSAPKYTLIVVDPPWHYKSNGKTFEGTANAQYTVMRDADLLHFDIDRWADPHECILLMWTTAPKLQFATKVIASWRFKYKTVFLNWIKTKQSGCGHLPVMGLGFYTRTASEFLLLATRGCVQRKYRIGKNVSQVLFAPGREHSRKPDAAFDRIENVFDCNALRKIELFSREHRSGWDSWGNETGKFSPTNDGNLIEDISSNSSSSSDDDDNDDDYIDTSRRKTRRMPDDLQDTASTQTNQDVTVATVAV
jgi:N6-adenosine-specific RNA methylase IME4